MPEWLFPLIGIGAGVCVVGGSLVWAFKPRRRSGRSRLPPSSDTDDPMTAANLDHHS